MTVSPYFRGALVVLALEVFAQGILCLRAAPRVTRLTPPSALFSYGDDTPPYIARFLTGQRFDLQATIRPDPGQTIVDAQFLINNSPVGAGTLLHLGGPVRATVATLRAFSVTTAGTHRFSVRVTQSDGTQAIATGNFECVALRSGNGLKARNIILMIGDGMGAAHRTAARVMLHGVSQGKSLAPLAMDSFPNTAMVKTASLNSIITDSAPGAAAYTTGNKGENAQISVFPDDTPDCFDNPRVETIAEYLARTQGKWLGIVTTADVADATPAAFAAHTQDRGAGSGIVDGYFDEARTKANLRVLLGGGRRWFLPSTTPGSIRTAALDGVLPAELASGWGVVPGVADPERDLLAEFTTAGFSYVANSSQLSTVPAGTGRLLGLFNFGHLNAALDRINKRRGISTVVDDFGFPNQPMLDEMTDAAIAVLRQNSSGFVLLIEGALIDKQSHVMDTERWLHEVIEFDRAVARAKAFAESVPDTLVIVTADHETAGVNLIGASAMELPDLARRAVDRGGSGELRDPVVGGGFSHYAILNDGYPETPDVSRRLLIGYGANADRYEDWITNPKPTAAGGPAGYPNTPMERDVAGGYLIIGQVPGPFASHTGNDVPLSAFGRGSELFSGVLDNTDVFFKAVQISFGVPSAFSVESSAIATGQRTAGDRLTNLSSRGIVGPDAESMINGFVLTGSRPHRLLMRGIGPSLAGLGVANVLRDPIVRLRRGDGTLLAVNDDWESDSPEAIRDASVRVGAFTLPAGSKDSALLLELPPGAYTVQITSANASSGTALLEIYELP